VLPQRLIGNGALPLSFSPVPEADLSCNRVLATSSSSGMPLMTRSAISVFSMTGSKKGAKHIYDASVEISFSLNLRSTQFVNNGFRFEEMP
jgi:hypothetical protein